MKRRLEEFMRGRYGVDDLSKALLGLCVGLMVLNLFLRVRGLNTLVLVLFVVIYYRMFSRQSGKRYAENQKWLRLKTQALARLGRIRRVGPLRPDFRTHHVYRCPSCGQKIRVPRKRGHIAITCPKCRTEFEKNS